jgi:hypothetical protein
MTNEDRTAGQARLKPCPFCGAKAVLTNVRMSGHTFKAGCYNETCWRPGTDGFDSEKAAIAAWNTRTPPQPESAKETES